MKYSEETVKKYFEAMKLYTNEYKNAILRGEFVELAISDGNDKIGHVPNVSQAAVLTCPYCDQCKWYCYDIKDCYRHGYDSTTMKSRARNTALLLYAFESYFDQLNAFLDNTIIPFFRFHVGGEIINAKHFAYMIDAVKRHPHITFWTYTKNYKVVNDYVRDHGGSIEAAIPANFSIMFSKWDGMPIDNPYGFPEFACKLEKGNKDTTEAEFAKMYHCPGNCEICIRARRGCIARENTFANEH